MHDRGGDLVAIFSLGGGEEKNFESLVGGEELFIVIDRRDGNFSLGDVVVLVNVLAQEANVLHTLLLAGGGHQLVENVVATLQRHLRDDSGLLEQVYEQVFEIIQNP